MTRRIEVSWPPVLLAVSGLLISGFLVACTDATYTSEASAERAEREAPDRSAVTALGRLEPGWGVVDVGAPPGDRIHELRVVEGDEVAVGDVLAVLESFDESRAQVAVSRAGVEEARQRLRRAREVGPVAVETREATVRRLEVDLKLAESDLGRTRRLVADEVVPERDSEFQGAVEAQARAALDEARSALERERREQRLAVAGAEAALATAQALLERDVAGFEQTEIRAPVAGSILDVYVFAGEATGEGPILRLGEVQAMYAVAELYESDARFVRPGQKATVGSQALPKALEGTVEQRSRIVRRNDVHDIDPTSDTDTRVIEARILLDDSETAADFVHLQVDVEIDVGGGS